jgi:YVTN family beta-propeller protein
MLFISKKCFGRRTFSGCLRLFAFALLAAAFAFTSAHAQTVGYISHNNSVVSVLDPATNTITESFALGGSTQFFVTTSPDGKHAYVSYSPEGLQAFIAVIDTATNQVTGTISFAGVPQGMAITPDGRKLYVTDVFNSNLLAFSTADGTLLSTIPVDPVPLNLAITPDGSRAYVLPAGLLMSLTL